jgi:6-phosphogluconolactonase
MQGGGGGFEEHDVMPPGGNADNPWMSFADIDGNGRAELLLAQRNFIRAVVLVSEAGPDAGKQSWSFQVKEQINGAASNSRIVGAAPLHNGTNEIASLFLLDAERRAVTLCERDDSGVWQVVRNIALPVSGFSALAAIGLGSANANSLALLGLNQVAWLSLEGHIWTLAELDGYETPIRDGWLNNVVAGDLNHDGRKDLVFLETARNHLDLVLFEPPHQLVPANRWPVFEERTFRARRNTLPEPREALIADVTGDGRNDLVVLVHDRVLVYPQETSTTSTTSSSEETMMLVYFGTYTRGASQGIYVSRLDMGTGELNPPELAGEAVNPSFLVIHPNRRFLYAVSEVNDFEEAEAGSVSAFAIERDSGTLALLNQQSSQGAWPCHIMLDADGRYALVANYGGGNAAVLPIKPDGRLGEATALVKHSGSSVNPQRQKAPHAHSINLDPHNRFAFVADLGIDKIMIYQFDPENGALLPNEPPHAGVAPGAGPRHFAFRPDGQFAYVINELNCTITAFSYDAERGNLKEVQTVSTLPEGESVQSGYSTAEVQVHPSGRFLYGSNRGHNTIAVFRIDEEAGTVKLVQHQSTLGKTPRNFGIDPTGRYLVAANQDSDSVAVFRIDPAGGQLQATGEVIEVPAPVCVKFLSLER